MPESFYNKISSHKSSAILYMILGSILIGIGPFFVEFSPLHEVTSTFYRLLIGGSVFLSICIIQKTPFPQNRSLVLSILAGLILALDLTVWNLSVRLIGSGLSTVLSNLEIFFLGIIGFLFFKEKISSTFIYMLLLISVGVICLIHPFLTEIKPSYFWGIILGVSGSLIYSVYLLLLKSLSTQIPKLSSNTVLATTCSFGALILGCIIAITNPSLLIVDSVKSFGFIFANSFLSQILGWWLITNALKQLPLSLSGILLLTQPALTFLLDCLFLGRNTQPSQIFGCCILFIAIYFTAKHESKKEIVT